MCLNGRIDIKRHLMYRTHLRTLDAALSDETFCQESCEVGAMTRDRWQGAETGRHRFWTTLNSSNEEDPTHRGYLWVVIPLRWSALTLTLDNNYISHVPPRQPVNLGLFWTSGRWGGVNGFILVTQLNLLFEWEEILTREMMLIALAPVATCYVYVRLHSCYVSVQFPSQ